MTFNQILKNLNLLILTVFIFQYAYATHNRAGQITYEHIGENTYRITLKIYTYTLSPADDPKIEVPFGDGTSEMVVRTTEVYLPNNYIQNTYIVDHKYPGPGTYIISIEEPGRNAGIRNIQNSVNMKFALKTILQINSSLGANSSPYFENLPMGMALIDSIYTYNSKATDPDGDSLSYKLTACLGENAEPIDNYQYPEASISFGIDPVSGDLVWNKPIHLGLYSIAIEIEEWRSGIKIGSVIRDIQIQVVDELMGMPDISESKIKAYPNPTKDIVRFDFAGNEIEHIRVMDLNGKIILEKKAVSKNETINLSKFSDGIYFILIKTDRKSLFHKIIKD